MNAAPLAGHTSGCVHCGLCLPVCPTYRVLGSEAESPRGRLYLMRALGEGRIDPTAIAPHLDACLGCRACETACPAGVPYGELLETTRAALQPQATGIRARLVRFLLQHVIARQRRLRLLFRLLRCAEVLGLRRLATLLRLLPRAADQMLPRVPPEAARAPLATGLHRPAGPERGRVALFTGCVMEQLFGDVNRKTLELLVQNGFAVDVPAAQACCGALLVHNGQTEAARALARTNVAAFAAAEVVIVNSAGCGATLQGYGHLLHDQTGSDFGRRVRDVCQFLDEQGLSRTPALCAKKVAYDDPCHLCHGQGVRDEPRRLLAQVPGLQLVAHDRPEDCCGSAGIYNLLQPDLAGRIGARKIESLATSGAELVATGNPGCMLQISAHARQRRLPLQVVHPVELLLPAPTTATMPAPTRR